MHFLLLMSRQGKVRLAKWYSTYSQKERAKIMKDVTPMVLGRPLKLCNFLDWRDQRLIYKRYASLYFVCGVDTTDNELLVLETIHHFVEVLDKYFGNVCELDLIFNFHKVRNQTLLLIFVPQTLSFLMAGCDKVAPGTVPCCVVLTWRSCSAVSPSAAGLLHAG